MNNEIDLDNICILSDSYKLNHWDMLVDETENSYAYFESRKGAKYPYTHFFGLQFISKMFLQGPVVTKDRIDEAEEFASQHFGFDKFNRKMWEYILDNHGGHLPVKIRAVPEGSIIPIGHPLMNVTVTDENVPKVAALPNHLETILTHVWYPSNIATIGYDIKQFLKEKFIIGADTMDALPFMLHDFGFRGATCVQGAGIGGAAHLVNFMGTDTTIGIQYGRKYYNTHEMLGFSVAASEHSIKTSLGKEGEHTITRRLLEKYPDGILSDVQDSYSIEDSIEYIGTNLKTKILNRNGKYVFRPDSPRFKGDTPKEQILWIAQRLEHYFGAATNKKGYKVLNPKVGIIYGDGLSVEEIKDAVIHLMANGFSPETCVYGMGGGLMQKHNRDTQRNAFKSSAQKRAGVWYDVFKNPADVSKASKKGRVETFVGTDKHYYTGLQGDAAPFMSTVFENGKITKEYRFEDIRDNAEMFSKYVTV